VFGAEVSGGFTATVLGSGSAEGEQAASVAATMMAVNNVPGFMVVLLKVFPRDGERWVLLNDFVMSASCDSECPPVSVTSWLRGFLKTSSDQGFAFFLDQTLARETVM
jgi:hypothetical protein